MTSRTKAKNPYDMVDPRQREAACILLGAVDLPAEAWGLSQLWLTASKLSPWITVEAACLGDRRKGLERAQELIGEVLSRLSSDVSSPQPDPSHDR